MKIALFGQGKMGKLITQRAFEQGHEIVFIDRHLAKEEQKRLIDLSDIALDFSHANAVSSHVDLCIQRRKNLVIGTTGWDEHYENIKLKILQSEIGCLYSPNFSIGVALFKQLVAKAAHLLANDYDVAGIELHHRQKADAPSGTAKALTKEILELQPHLENFNFASVRCGNIPGTHTLLFDSPSDRITLTHEAHNRDGFALGALKAVEWLHGKQGFLTLNDFILGVLK